jgi:Ser/Thr protein kinase RdoA (MazF antagonist)
MHDRFWALTEDLEAFFWLSDSVGADFEVHVAAAVTALQHLVDAGEPELLAGSSDRVALLTRLADRAEKVVQPLRTQPGTLLHGDYWPGNIAIVAGGRQSVYDWQLAGVGPAVMDLLVFVNKTDWWFGPLGDERSRLIRRYRNALEARSGVAWDDATWDMLWDHALMWRFLQEWLDLLAVTPGVLLTTRAEQLEQVWLGPLKRAVDTWLVGS